MLKFVEQAIEALEVRLPHGAILLKPGAGLGEPLSLDPPRPPLRVLSGTDQPRALQDLQVLGDRGLAHRERRREFADGRVPAREPRKDGAPGGIGQREERGVELVGSGVHCLSVK